ncbi:MAG: hypothetical protein ACRCXM_12575, partial [Beijerinckiaceae bacterium]
MRAAEAGLLRMDNAAGAAQADTRGGGVKDFVIDKVPVLGAAAKRLGPDIATKSSPNVETQRLSRDLIESPLMMADNARGVDTVLGGGPAVSRQVRDGQHEAMFITRDALGAGYQKYFFGEQPPNMLQRAQASLSSLRRGDGEGKLTRLEFNEEVGRALRSGRSDVPEALEAASSIRKVLDNWGQRAVDAGVLDKETFEKNKASYVSRFYNREKINAAPDEFDRMVVSELKREQERQRGIQQNMETAHADFTRLVGAEQKLRAKIERLETSKTKLDAAKKERASSVREAQGRLDTLAAQADNLRSDLSELAEFTADLKANALNPAFKKRAEQLEKEARRLMAQEAKMEKTFNENGEQIMRREVEGIIKKAVSGNSVEQIATRIFLGDTNPMGIKQFWVKIRDSGGIIDVGGELQHILGGE